MGSNRNPTLPREFRQHFKKTTEEMLQHSQINPQAKLFYLLLLQAKDNEVLKQRIPESLGNTESFINAQQERLDAEKYRKIKGMWQIRLAVKLAKAIGLKTTIA